MGKFDIEIALREQQNHLDEVALADCKSGATVDLTGSKKAALKSRITKRGRLIKWYEKINAQRT